MERQELAAVSLAGSAGWDRVQHSPEPLWRRLARALSGPEDCIGCRHDYVCAGVGIYIL